MKDQERIITGGLVGLMLLLWLGFLVHRSPGFPGSLGGSVIGGVAALLMLGPLLYLIIKRIPFLRRTVTHLVPMRTLLAWHIYAGILGPILGLIHSGHRFESPLGMALTGFMLVVVMSGFIGRYILGQVAKDIGEKSGMLKELRAEYERAAMALHANPDGAVAAASRFTFIAWLYAPDWMVRIRDARIAHAVRVSESISDLEFAIRSDQLLREVFRRWLMVHIVISLLLYALLAAHIGAATYFGLRWLR
jgi:hypothetical protein